MRSRFFYLFTIFLFIITANNVSAKSDPHTIHRLPTGGGYKFLGTWAWVENDKSQSFELTIWKYGDNLMGNYCSIMDDGNKQDCSENKKNISFSIPDTVSESFTIVFRSSTTETYGQATVSLDGDYLNWEVIKKPTGEYYCPDSARLKKIKSAPSPSRKKRTTRSRKSTSRKALSKKTTSKKTITTKKTTSKTTSKKATTTKKKKKHT